MTTITATAIAITVITVMAAKLRTILQVLPRLRSGGVERGTIEIAKSIVDSGMTAVVVSSGGPMVKELEELGAEHIVLDVATKNPFKMVANIWKIADIIRRYKVSLVHARSRAPAWSVYYAAKRTGIPMVTTFHGVYGINPSLKKIYNSVMLKGNKVIAVSEFVKRHILKNYKVDERKIVVIPRGADMERINPANVVPEQLEELRREWRIPEGMPVVMMPTRITPIKGIEVLMQAVRDIPEVFCAIVGSDYGREAYKESLVAKAAEFGLQDRFVFYPQKKIEAVHFALCDIFASLSVHPESFGRTITEAQAMGKIAIASNHGGAAEIIEDGKNGFLVEPGNAVATGAAIRRVLSLSEKERRTITEAAIHNVVSKYSIGRMCESTINLYEDILS